MERRSIFNISFVQHLHRSFLRFAFQMDNEGRRGSENPVQQPGPGRNGSVWRQITRKRDLSRKQILAIPMKVVWPLPKAARVSTNAVKFNQKARILAEKSSQEAAFQFGTAASAPIRVNRTEVMGGARPPPRRRHLSGLQYEQTNTTSACMSTFLRHSF